MAKVKDNPTAGGGSVNSVIFSPVVISKEAAEAAMERAKNTTEMQKKIYGPKSTKKAAPKRKAASS